VKRYLTDCAGTGQQAGQGGQGASTLTLRKAYAASVVLTGRGLQLDFAQLPSDVLLSMAQVFIGPTGDKASISATQPNAIKQGPDGKMLVDDVTGTNCNTDFSTIYQLSK
jgi:hypothetical protein